MEENRLEWIETVQVKNEGYLVNGTLSVPKADGNRQYEDLKIWLEDNTPEPEYTDEELVELEISKNRKAFNDAILKHLDTQCTSLGFTGDDKTRPYRSIANYVGFDNVFKEEAEKLGRWIALVFQASEQIEAEVLSGDREMPTIDEVLQELPKYEL